MPSKNSVNKPKLAVRHSRKSVQGQHRRSSRISATVARTTGVHKPDSVIRTRVLSRKQAQKNSRNLRYFAQKGLIEDVMTDAVSRTQVKKEERERLFAIEGELRAQKAENEMEVTATGRGTTLGGPPTIDA